MVRFSQTRITEAIWKAAKSEGGKDKARARFVSNQVIEELNKKFDSHTIPSVEDIQDTVEKVLIENGHARTAKAYILYRDLHSKIREIDTLVNSDQIIGDYLKQLDWRVKENSNMAYSLQGLNNHVASTVSSNYWLNRIYPLKIRQAHASGDLHIHDLQMLSVYCCGWDLQDLLRKGFGGVPGKIECKPAKHFRTALGQLVNFFYTMQGEAAGAQAVANFDTLLAPFIYYDKLDYPQIVQAMQEFIFNMNVPTRVGFQTPFTNITMDLVPPKKLGNESVIIGGEIKNKKYADFQKEMNLVNRAFAEVMLEGDAKGRVFTFPIPTYNITKDFDWKNQELEPVWEMTRKYGIPYFSNFVNSDMDPDDARSMCCRLRLDNRELRSRGGGLFAANPLTGSIGVVTINMARIGYLAVNEEDYFECLGTVMDLAKESLDLKRRVLEELTKQGLYPYSQVYLDSIYSRFGEYWRNHFSTIGLNGLNESIVNFLSTDIGSREGLAFAKRVLTFMRKRIGDYQKETNQLFNLEASPAEATSYRFAKADKLKYPGIIVANEANLAKGANPYYTNSSHLPVNYTEDIFELLELQDPLQVLYTGGTVIHLFMGESLPDTESVKTLVRKIANTYKLPYFSLTPTFSICPKHGYLSGEHKYCPKCDDELGIKPIKEVLTA